MSIDVLVLWLLRISTATLHFQVLYISFFDAVHFKLATCINLGGMCPIISFRGPGV
jgi:hypothetical protein